MTFRCECCKYGTSNKSNYNKHLLSKKHILLFNNKPETDNDTFSIKSQPKNTFKTTESQPKGNPESTSPFCCKYCQQQFKFKQSMYRHIKYSCTKNKTEDLVELVRLLNLQLDKVNDETKTEIGYLIEKFQYKIVQKK